MESVILSEGDQRKLVAVMFTDIVGFTALSQTDESRAMEVLERHNRLLRSYFPKYRGREVKTIGDGFLVEFESALDAANCSIEIQKSLHDYNDSIKDDWKIKIRIGIHAGDILRKGGDIFGDAVNIASRIQPLANPEGVCISQQVFDQIHNKSSFEFRKLKEPVLKNVNFPTNVYAIVFPWEKEEPSQRSTSSEKADVLDRLRVAVLPFSSITPDPSDEYFVDGMTEEVISTISNISGLAVISRTSSMQYKNASKKMQDIGRELNVGSVLEGSVRKAENRLRIAVQLIDVVTDRHIWADNYDRDFEDVFAIQSDIARKVAESLEIRLLASEKKRIEKDRTGNAAAHTLYLKGRYFWNERNEESIEKAMEYFRLATEKDPSFALAYCGMVDCYAIMPDFGLLSFRELFPKARELVLKALAIDPDLAEAHASYGLLLEGNWDFDAAESEFKTAIALNPNYASAHQWFGLHLERARRFDEALIELEKARRLDPLSLQIQVNFAVHNVSKGEYLRAVTELKSILDSNPNFRPAQTWIIIAYAASGMIREALDEVKRPKTDLSTITTTVSGYAYAKAGMKKEAVEVIDRLKKRSESEYVDPELIAVVCASLGMKDEAFTWLEEGYKERSTLMLYIQVYPWYADLRADPRFVDLVRRMGFKA